MSSAESYFETCKRVSEFLEVEDIPSSELPEREEERGEGDGVSTDCEGGRELVTAVEVREVKRVRVAAVDSSTRTLETVRGNVVVGAVASYVSSPPTYFSYPPVYESSPPGPGVPFVYMLLKVAKEKGGQTSSIAWKNVSGESLDHTYSSEEAARELRIRLETWMMQKMFDEAEVILLDGPLYYDYRGLYERDLPQKYRKALDELFRERQKALRNAEERGKPVVGIVKRAERASLLRRTSLPLHDAETDVKILHRHIVKKRPSLSFGHVFVSPQCTVTFNDPSIMPKVIQYLVIPIGAYQHDPSSLRFYRVETTPSSLKLLRDMGLSPLDIAIRETVAGMSRESLSVLLSHKLANVTVDYLKKVIRTLVLQKGVALSFSEGRAGS